MAQSASANQQQLVLRLPDDVAHSIRKSIKKGISSESREASAASASGQGQPEQGGGSGFPIIHVQPERDPAIDGFSNLFTVRIGEIEYPSLLLNLPTPVETHKTFDNKIFVKSGDIGQMLHVFHTAKERDIVRQSKIHKTQYGEYYASGLSAPTTDIVKRRFELTATRSSKAAQSFLPYNLREVTENVQNGTEHYLGGNRHRVLQPVSAPRSSSAKGGGANSGRQGAVSLRGAPPEFDELEKEEEEEDEFVEEEVVEEVVDFEDWMVSDRYPTGVRATMILSRRPREDEEASAEDTKRGIGASSSALDREAEKVAKWQRDLRKARIIFEHPEILLTQTERDADRIDEMLREDEKERQQEHDQQQQQKQQLEKKKEKEQRKSTNRIEDSAGRGESTYASEVAAAGADRAESRGEVISLQGKKGEGDEDVEGRTKRVDQESINNNNNNNIDSSSTLKLSFKRKPAQASSAIPAATAASPAVAVVGLRDASQTDTGTESISKTDDAAVGTAVASMAVLAVEERQLQQQKAEREKEGEEEEDEAVLRDRLASELGAFGDSDSDDDDDDHDVDDGAREEAEEEEEEEEEDRERGGERNYEMENDEGEEDVGETGVSNDGKDHTAVAAVQKEQQEQQRQQMQTVDLPVEEEEEEED